MRKVVARQHFPEFTDLNHEIDGIYFVSNRQLKQPLTFEHPKV